MLCTETENTENIHSERSQYVKEISVSFISSRQNQGSAQPLIQSVGGFYRECRAAEKWKRVFALI